jgi:plasmid stabilization system protein ParE
MRYELVVQSEAIIEMQESFEWYETRRSGLGYEFIEEIEDGFEKLSQSPQHYSAVDQVYRKLRIRRFPYLIVFEIEDGKVVVIAVRRVSQEPRF